MRRLPEMAVIAVLADVDRTDRDRRALQLHQLGREADREVIAFGRNPDKYEVLRSPVALHDLVGDARKRPADLLGVHDRRFETTLGNAHASSRSRSAMRTCSPLRAWRK